MRKKRILLLMSALNGGGAEKVLIDYLRNFNYQKYDVSLCLVIHEGIYIKDIPKEVSLLSLYTSFSLFPYRFEHWFSKFLGWNYFQKKRVKSHFKDKNFDVVISFMEGIPLKFHNYFLEKAPRHFSWVHLDLYKDHYSLSCFKSKSEEQNLYQKMDAIIFVSEDAKNQFNKLYSLAVSQQVIYNIVDKAAILKTINNSYSFNPIIKIGAVGRLENQKRFDRLIDAAKLLKDAGLKFTIDIIGEGSLRLDLEQSIEEKGLSEFVFLKGFVTPPYDLINACDFIVSTSEAEGFSLVIAEALCLGKAVICTPTAGPIELLGNGKYGIICEHDVNSIYEAMKSFILDRNQLAIYQKLATERSSFFQVRQSVEALEKLIDND